jgi:BirA family biotin operon repressor/biotin-[acetyl-CoA-carboxylase] ligase
MSDVVESPSTWADELMPFIDGPAWSTLGVPRLIDRVVVLAETGSTQDAALRLAGGRPGLMVVAVRQTAGRGRLGRAWVDTSHLGLAVTFVLDAASHTPEHLSLAAGLAAWEVVFTSTNASDRMIENVGLRWPNDVVELHTPHRKVAGVLIEVRDHLALVGVGINVSQRSSDWSSDLRARAVSIFQLTGRDSPRHRVAQDVLWRLCASLREPSQRLAEHWSRFDILRNSRRSFIHNNQTYTGLVRAIDPTNQILLQLDDGTLHALPALTTSLVHDT